LRSKEEIQKEYDEVYRKKPDKWGTPDRSDFMVKMLEPFIPNPENVIDIGCGNGIALENYRRYKPNANLYGIDPSIEGLRLSKERVPDGHFTTEDEFEDIKKFDLVFCLGVAEHVEDLPNFLKSLKDKTKEGGFCYFEVPHNLVYSKGPETFRRLTVGSKQIEWHLKRNAWEALLIKAGFKIVKRIRGENVTWEFIWILK